MDGINRMADEFVRLASERAQFRAELQAANEKNDELTKIVEDLVLRHRHGKAIISEHELAMCTRPLKITHEGDDVTITVLDN